MTSSEILINDMNSGAPERDAYEGVLMGKNREDEKATYITRRSALAGLMLIGGGIMMAGNEGIRGFFGTLFNYGNLSDSYHEMMRTSHDPDIRFGNFSPDGTKVVLNYRPMVDNEDRISYIGILKIATGELQLIRPPKEYRMWYDGSFSPDGKEMAFSFIRTDGKMGLALLDLSTLAYRLVLVSELAKKNASFSPDGNRLIYISATNDSYVYKGQTRFQKADDVFELEIRTGKEMRLTQLHFMSGGTAPRYFSDGERYIFSAEYPYSFAPVFEQAKEFQKLYQSNTIYFFDRNFIQTAAVPAIIHKNYSEFADLSQDGAKSLCIALSDLHKNNQKEKYNYELFMHENGQMQQLTDLQWMIIDAALSPDGKEAVFVADTTPSRGSARKVYLYNIKTNTTAPIELKPEKTSWLDIPRSQAPAWECI